MAAVQGQNKRGASGRRILRWVGYLSGGLVGLIVIGALAIYTISESRVQKIYTTQPEAITISSDAAMIERGRHLVVNVMACVICHGDNLAGGTVLDDSAIGHAYAANLTTGNGGIGGRLSDTDIVRVLRHGVKPDGRSLFVMPVEDYVALNETDMAAIIAYLRSVPTVDQQQPVNSIGPIGRALLTFNQANLLSAETVPQTGGFPAAVSAGPTVEYGRYLARASGCMGCHGATLSGGPIPGGPPGLPPPLNITPAGVVAEWTDAQLATLIRTGKRPDGSQINAFMPYQAYAGLTDQELQAIIAYLRSVPAKPYGNR
jgi:mono/diheme cytochrome c family protein